MTGQNATEIRREITELRNELAGTVEESERRDLMRSIEELRHRLWMMGEELEPQ